MLIVSLELTNSFISQVRGQLPNAVVKVFIYIFDALDALD